jgi:hypothetical protein
MVLGQVLAVGGIPGDWPIVYPISIYALEVRTVSVLLHVSTLNDDLQVRIRRG